MFGKTFFVMPTPWCWGLEGVKKKEDVAVRHPLGYWLCCCFLQRFLLLAGTFAELLGGDFLHLGVDFLLEKG